VLAFIQDALKAAVLEVQEYVLLLKAVLRAIFTPPYYRRDIIQQLDTIGIGSLTVVSLAGFFTGAALALQTGQSLDQFGARTLVGRLVSASMIRELGPVLTALMFAGRVGSGIAAELGSMVVTDQVNALRALGTEPLRKLVVPRVIATTLMAPVLTVIADTFAIVAGWLISLTKLHVGSSTYWTAVVDGLFLGDAWQGLIKPVVLGFIIGTVGCHVGLRTAGGTQGVGRATTNSVVVASVLVIAADFFLTPLLMEVLY
jgi:phospholipid/cholesterol/gamma-HCH transport system permease protein